MTPANLKTALGNAARLRVQTRSGKVYDVERDVILCNQGEADPLIYGWPVVPTWHRSHGRVRWFRSSSLRLHLPQEDAGYPG